MNEPSEPDSETVEAVMRHFDLADESEVTSDLIEQFYEDKRCEWAERRAGR